MSKIELLYEDNHILVVVKPPNILTQGDQTGDKDMLELLKEDLKIRYNKPGNVFLGLVHRLDRPVGGVMVFAKTSKAASRLSEQIRARSFSKTYLAVVHGVPEKTYSTLEHYLVKNEKTNYVSIVDPLYNKNTAAKKAVLDYELKKSNGEISLVKVRLHTGRPHQIRVQLASIGNPLYGDQKYGGGINKPGMQLALWSAEIGFEHPTKKIQMSFKSNPPGIYPWNAF
jgi:23S rRNA pseudouridine1911/1915/1917 synthase